MSQRAGKKRNNSTRINVTLPAPLIKKLDKAALYNLTSRSAILRWALMEWLDAQEKLGSQGLFPAGSTQKSSLSVQQIVALARKGVTVNWDEPAFKPAFNSFIGKQELTLQEMQDALTLYEEADSL